MSVFAQNVVILYIRTRLLFENASGSFVQIWRMIDLIYRPEEEVIAELDKFKSHLLACSTSSSS